MKVKKSFNNDCLSGFCYIIVSEKKEKKTEHVQLLMQPTVLKMGKEAAEQCDLSLNEFMHRLIIRYCKEERI